MARISFLIPIYNGELYLAETLTSALTQDYNDYDIVIIDDGSTDQTADIIDRFQSPKIKYHKIDNSGLVKALNYGMQLLDCEYIARLDADDICFTHRLSRQLDFIEFTRADAISCRVMNINSVGRVSELSFSNDTFLYYNPSSIPAREPYLPHPFLTMRLDALKALNGFRHAHLAEDADLCWRLAHDYRIALQNDVLGKYRIRNDSVSNQTIQSGRIQAFYSELSALNAVRRKNNQAEIPYNLSYATAKTQASSLQNLIDTFRLELTAQEVKHLAASAAMKLLDISTFRYLPLEKSDIQFAKSSIRDVALSKIDGEKVRSIFKTVKNFHPHLFTKNFLTQFFTASK